MLLPVRAAYGSVVLRRFRVSDAERVASLCSDEAVATMTAAIPHPYTARMAREWIAEQLPDGEPEDTYAVLRRADELLIGAVGLRHLASAPDMLGYWIGRPYWGHGHATDAATAALALAFTVLELDAVRARHLERNPASGRVLEKAGMREVQRQLAGHRGGAPEPFRVWEAERVAWLAWMER